MAFSSQSQHWRQANYDLRPFDSVFLAPKHCGGSGCLSSSRPLQLGATAPPPPPPPPPLGATSPPPPPHGLVHPTVCRCVGEWPCHCQWPTLLSNNLAGFGVPLKRDEIALLLWLKTQNLVSFLSLPWPQLSFDVSLALGAWSPCLPHCDNCIKKCLAVAKIYKITTTPRKTRFLSRTKKSLF